MRLKCPERLSNEYPSLPAIFYERQVQNGNFKIDQSGDLGLNVVASAKVASADSESERPRDPIDESVQHGPFNLPPLTVEQVQDRNKIQLDHEKLYYAKTQECERAHI